MCKQCDLVVRFFQYQSINNRVNFPNSIFFAKLGSKFQLQLSVLVSVLGYVIFWCFCNSPFWVVLQPVRPNLSEINSLKRLKSRLIISYINLRRFQSQTLGYHGQWLWLSWQSGHFRALQFESSHQQKFIMNIFTVNC